MKLILTPPDHRGHHHGLDDDDDESKSAAERRNANNQGDPASARSSGLKLGIVRLGRAGGKVGEVKSLFIARLFQCRRRRLLSLLAVCRAHVSAARISLRVVEAPKIMATLVTMMMMTTAAAASFAGRLIS